MPRVRLGRSHRGGDRNRGRGARFSACTPARGGHCGTAPPASSPKLGLPGVWGGSVVAFFQVVFKNLSTSKLGQCQTQTHKTPLSIPTSKSIIGGSIGGRRTYARGSQCPHFVNLLYILVTTLKLGLLSKPFSRVSCGPSLVYVVANERTVQWLARWTLNPETPEMALKSQRGLRIWVRERFLRVATLARRQVVTSRCHTSRALT